MCKMRLPVIALVLAAGAFSAIYAQPYSIQQYLNIRSASEPEFSPDGKQLVYLTNATGTSQVWTMDVAGGTPRQLTNYDDNISFVRWVGEGNGIVFGKAKGAMKIRSSME